MSVTCQYTGKLAIGGDSDGALHTRGAPNRTGTLAMFRRHHEQMRTGRSVPCRCVWRLPSLEARPAADPLCHRVTTGQKSNAAALALRVSLTEIELVSDAPFSREPWRRRAFGLRCQANVNHGPSPPGRKLIHFQHQAGCGPSEPNLLLSTFPENAHPLIQS